MEIKIDGWGEWGVGEGGLEYKFLNCKTYVKLCVIVIDRIDLCFKFVYVNKIKFVFKI